MINRMPIYVKARLFIINPELNPPVKALVREIINKDQHKNKNGEKNRGSGSL